MAAARPFRRYAIIGQDDLLGGIMNKQQIELLSKEVEMLMAERARLLKLVGAAAVLVANTDAEDFPEAALDAAETLSEALNVLPEETLKDALNSVQAETE